MKIEEIEVRQFDKGMVDSIELGQSYNNNYSAPIVKYLENLTPNIITGALCKRPNYTTFALYATADASELPEINDYSAANFLDYAGKRYVTGYFPHKFFKQPSIADPEESVYVDMMTGEESFRATYLYNYLGSMKASRALVGMDRFDMRNPVAGNIYMVLLRDDLIIDNLLHQSTSVNGFYYSKSLDPLAVSGFGWLNPLYDGEYQTFVGNPPVYSDMPFGYQGKRINGIVKDWVVVGQAVYLVSVPDKEHASLPASPVYRWSPVAANAGSNISSIFTASKAKRSYYAVNSDGDINAKYSAILTPFATGEYLHHPQYKGNSDLFLSDTTVGRAEIFDFDGFKNSVDVLWWQTDHLPNMKDFDGTRLQDIDYNSNANTDKTNSNRLKRFVANLEKINLVENSVSDSRRKVLAAENKTISVNNLPSRINPGQLTPVEYWYVDGYEITPGDNGDSDLVIYTSVPIGAHIVGYFAYDGMPPEPDIPLLGSPPTIALYAGRVMGDIFGRLRSTPDTTERFVKVFVDEDDPTAIQFLKVKPSVYVEYFDDVGTVVDAETDIAYTLSGRTLNKGFLRGMNWLFRQLILAFPPLLPNKQPSLSLLPDYKKASMPRLWQTSSNIPFILTAVLDGVEFIVLQDTYVVATGDPAAILDSQSFVIKPLFLPDLSYSPVQATIRGVTENSNSQYDDFAQSSRVPFVCFTLRINLPQTQSIWNVFPIGLTSFKLYVSYPNLASSGFFDESGDWAKNDGTSPGSYVKPLVQDSVSRAYGLVKEFLVREDPDLQMDGVADDFYSYNFGEQGTKAVAHGKWVKYPSPENSISQGIGSPQLIDNGGSGYYYIPYADSTFSLVPTPDFYLWDYAYGPALVDNLQNLAVGWDGIGARCITQVSNRVVIGGTIDKDGSEEVGRIRAAATQGTTMLNTVFAELDALDLCSTPIEALANFRNDLWVFSHSSIVRVSPTNPYSMTTWQIADTIDGQGILNRKHLIQVPDGIYFANATGLWFVNGSQIENVALPVLQTYRFMYNPAFSDWQGYNKYSVTPISGTFNPSLELSYDAFRNEIVLSVSSYRTADNLADMPFQESVDLQLRYNLSAKTFHIETLDLPSGRHHYQSFAHSEYCRVRFNDHDTKLVIPLLYDRSISWVKGGNYVYDTLELFYTYDRLEAHARFDDNRYFGIRTWLANKWYAGYVTLHELGDGLNDYLLRQAIVEVSPIEHIDFSVVAGGNLAEYAWRDPKLLIQYRNRENRNWLPAANLPAVPFPADVDQGIYDLVELNSRLTAPKEIFWSDLNRPISRAFPRESIVLNTPLNAKFRRFEVTFITTSLTYLKGFKFKFAKYFRKTFG